MITRSTFHFVIEKVVVLRTLYKQDYLLFLICRVIGRQWKFNKTWQMAANTIHQATANEKVVADTVFDIIISMTVLQPNANESVIQYILAPEINGIREITSHLFKLSSGKTNPNKYKWIK